MTDAELPEFHDVLERLARVFPAFHTQKYDFERVFDTYWRAFKPYPLAALRQALEKAAWLDQWGVPTPAQIGALMNLPVPSPAAPDARAQVLEAGRRLFNRLMAPRGGYAYDRPLLERLTAHRDRDAGAQALWDAYKKLGGGWRDGGFGSWNPQQAPFRANDFAEAFAESLMPTLAPGQGDSKNLLDDLGLGDSLFNAAPRLDDARDTDPPP